MMPMCGIVGYVGPQPAQSILLAGLARLEYRGYDSAGIAVVDGGNRMHAAKRAGKLQVLRDELLEHPLPEGNIGIGHTRWATHGPATDANAHPQLSDDGRLAVVHNGIIENYLPLRRELEAEGVRFTSDTDTEVAAHLLGREYRRTGSLEAAFRAVVPRLDGAFTLVAIHADDPETLVGARLNSPLVVGLGVGENFLGSDVAAFVEHTRHAIALGQDQVVVVRADEVTISTFAGEAATGDEFTVDWDTAAAEKGGWSSFMAKEITESPEAIERTLLGRIADGRVAIPGLDTLDDAYFCDLDRILLLGCGTAYYSGLTAAYALEPFTQVPVTVELAHEFRYRDPILNARTLVVVISQSGETMDTLMALRYAREHGAKTVAVCNTQGASIPREADAVVYTHAGPEVAVASTKAFVAQIAGLYLLGLHIAQVRGSLAAAAVAEQVSELATLPAKMTEVLELHERIRSLAKWMSDTRSVLFLGRSTGYPIALEGALKLKEIAYIHAEGFAAGELKHGPIALIEPGQPVFVVVPSPRHDNTLHPKVVSNIQEIRARGARVLAVCEEGDAAVLPFADEVFPVPPTNHFAEPFLRVMPLQLFALELATMKGLDVDQPRNLAKSVTVE